jgi:hypothetical protein
MMDLEFFVEYYPNVDEGEQAQELSESDFIGLIVDHKNRGIEPIIDYDKGGSRLTIRDENGVYYG